MERACYRKLNKYKYQLREDFEITIDIKGFSCEIEELVTLKEDGELRVSNGYAWDGASGPTIDTLSSMRGSLVHDVLYQLLRMEKLPQSQVIEADVVFRNIILKDGMIPIRARVWYRGLRLANGRAARPGTEEDEKIFCAP
ncbi:MAG: hypothetical protein ACJAUV_002105 [Flavobacteriales bacterium]|jgi:hypothetical protein